VIETSIGLDRMFLALFSHSLKDETLDDGTSRTVLSLPYSLAPNKVAVLPLVKKDGLPEKAKEIFNRLKLNFNCIYDEKDSIGKRYRRNDALGTPFCLTIDYETIDDGAVTIRERDTMTQKRIPILELNEYIDSKVNMNVLL
jgi:glycyl-tRNA synthetase